MFQPRLGLAYAITPKTAFRTGLGLFYNRPMINRDTALGGNIPFQVQQAVVNGSIDAPGGAARREFPAIVTSQDPVFNMPRAWNWNLTFERQLPGSTTVEVAYVGRKGMYNQRKRNINQLPAGTIQANPGVNPNALRPYLGYGPVSIAENSGRSQYHGLQVKIDRRFMNGLLITNSYTLGRSMDYANENTGINTPIDFNLSWARSDTDRLHNYVLSLKTSTGF